jgi:hypothetical protein
MTRTGLQGWLPACTLIILLAPAASAQDFGVLESAETINEGNFKLGAYPLFVLPDEGDNDFALAVAFGYGATDSVDVEGRATFSDDVTFIGGDVEYWFLKNLPLDLSGRGGFHAGFVDGDVGDTVGFDATLIASAPVWERVELVGALDLAFNSMDVGADDRDGFTTVHLVPGVEVAISPELDFLAEFGIGMTDRSSNYVGFGIAYYIR